MSTEYHPRSAGERRGTIVALHGLRESADTLRRLAKHWAAHGWDVVAPDLRGHGRSPRWDPADPLHPGDRLLADVRDAVGPYLARAGRDDEVVFYGHSAGGAIAAAAAEQAAVVHGVLLEDPFWRLPVTAFQDRFVAARAARELLAYHVWGQQRLEAHGASSHPRWQVWEVRQWARAQRQADALLVRNGHVIPTAPWPDTVSAIAASAPVLVVTGTAPDVGMTPDHRRVLADRGAEVVAIEGAGHFVRRDNPLAFARTTDAWLEQIRTVPGVRSGAAVRGRPERVSW
ncbi:alpha/beta fold hydrolase [Ruania alkalisoli]|uniref:Alpha/beta fold hydrolase n=1 Tax=Ruania alkalisoli TaxID=2779775 RepID=A0A7M1STL2_9MICO|nr:alpha/beta hydrolase [Ruania alkalisoli]QOR70457.1 alpha/beta fold hydrolase [Ruania alkalisoli]